MKKFKKKKNFYIGAGKGRPSAIFSFQNNSSSNMDSYDISLLKDWLAPSHTNYNTFWPLPLIFMVLKIIFVNSKHTVSEKKNSLTLLADLAFLCWIAHFDVRKRSRCRFEIFHFPLFFRSILVCICNRKKKHKYIEKTSRNIVFYRENPFDIASSIVDKWKNTFYICYPKEMVRWKLYYVGVKIGFRCQKSLKFVLVSFSNTQLIQNR